MEPLDRPLRTSDGSLPAFDGLRRIPAMLHDSLICVPKEGCVGMLSEISEKEGTAGGLVT